jgi:hypothetical protein
MTAERRDIPFGTNLRRIRMVVDLLRLSGEEAVDEIAPLIHPQMRMLAAPGIAPASRYESREDFLGYFGEASANGILIQPDASQIRVTPSGSVLVTGNLRIAGPDGVDEVAAWFVYTFRDGLIGSLETYLDDEMAEKAAGLD